MQRYRQWLQEWGSLVYRYIQKSILGLLVYKLLEDRLMGWTNQTIDSTVSSPGLIDSIKSVLLWFDSTGLGFYWNLVALTFLAILLLAFIKTQQQPSPDPQPPENDTPEDAEQKQRFRLFAQRVMHMACYRMQQVANQIHGTLFNGPLSTREERLLRYSIDAYLFFMQPLGDREEILLDFLAARESLRSNDFLFAQRLFVDLYKIYEYRRPWVRDMAWETLTNFSTTGLYKEWEKADDEMRKELIRLARDCRVLGDSIIDLDLPAPRRWAKGGP